MCIDEKEYIPFSDRTYRQRANRSIKKTFEQKECMLCGSKKNIHVHHIDHDPKNNDVWNLMFLCKKCHEGVHQGKKIFAKGE